MYQVTQHTKINRRDRREHKEINIETSSFLAAPANPIRDLLGFAVYPEYLKRHFLRLLFWIGLITSFAGCVSTVQALPQGTLGTVSSSAANRASTVSPSATSQLTHNRSRTPTETGTPGVGQVLTPGGTPAPIATSTTSATPGSGPTLITGGIPGLGLVLTPGEKPEPTIPQSPDTCRSMAGQMSISYVDSQVLARRVPFSLYLPPCYDPNQDRLYPVLYLLHGANADQTQWPDLNIEVNADAMIEQGVIAPLIVIMPGGDYRQGEDYGEFVLRDLIPLVERTLRAATDRGHRAIGGLSQGGYWALELGLAHPELFSAVGGHSAATDSSLTALLVQNQIPDLKALRIYLDVGDQDPLATGVAAFAGVLRDRGLAPVYHVYPGAHNRPYWRSHTGEYLSFYSQDW